MEFDHVTNRYLYPDRYIKMIPYFLTTGNPLFAILLTILQMHTCINLLQHSHFYVKALCKHRARLPGQKKVMVMKCLQSGNNAFNRIFSLISMWYFSCDNFWYAIVYSYAAPFKGVEPRFFWWVLICCNNYYLCN